MARLTVMGLAVGTTVGLLVSACVTAVDSAGSPEETIDDRQDEGIAATPLHPSEKAASCRSMELCGNGVDDDCDGRSDCQDTDCSTAPGCVPTTCTPTAATDTCGNGFDDDCDGHADCADADCEDACNSEGCVPRAELCGNELDDDCDGTADCSDSDCSTSAACAPSCTATTEICTNGTDDDCDGQVDCDDPACRAAPNCRPTCTPVTELCDNFTDDDCDGRVDCQDEQCANAGSCGPVCEPITEHCGNGRDDDCDGIADCWDSDCATSSSCQPSCVPSSEHCGNGADEDCDGQVDCDDSDCSGAPACTERCEPSEGDGCNGDMGYGDACAPQDNEAGCSPQRFFAWCNRRNSAYPNVWHNYLRTWVDDRCDGTVRETDEQYSDYYCEDSSGITYRCRTPLVLVFDGAPVQYRPMGAPTDFDFSTEQDGSGTRHDWPSARTPWLALDRDGDGKITSGRELFGSATAVAGGYARHGFEALAALDINRDGVVDAKDPAFAQLVLWFDDGDRVSAAQELRPLASAGVVALGLEFVRAPHCDRRGNCEIERAVMHFVDGTGARRTGTIVDVHLREQPLLACVR